MPIFSPVTRERAIPATLVECARAAIRNKVISIPVIKELPHAEEGKGL